MFRNPRFRVAQTGGRSWDGGLQVYNNPIPRWWLWLMVVAALFALAYWLLYPSWPLPDGHYPGVLEVELDSPDGRTIVPWSSAAETLALQQRGRIHARQQRLETAVLRSDFHLLVSTPNMRDYVLAVAKVPYLAYCSGCHGADGHGIDRLERMAGGTDLVAGAWRRDAGFAEIEQQLQGYNDGNHGGANWLPPAGTIGKLSALQIRTLTVYVHQLGH